MPTSVAIVGSSGYSGAELARLIAQSSSFDLVAAYSDRQKGERLAQSIPGLGRAGELRVRPQADAARAFEQASIVALATPAEVSLELAPHLIAGGARVIDLSGAFRIEDREVFRSYYGFEHTQPELLAEARYALPQVPGTAGQNAPPMARARLVANPGCYATAAILALAPLVHAKIVDCAGIFIDGKSGVSGAGRKVAEKLLFMEVAENLSAYRVADHQHTPEIELALTRVAGQAVTVTFAPHLIPIRRGLIATCYARALAEPTTEALRALVEGYYAESPGLFGAPVVSVGSTDEATVQSVWCTPLARIGLTADRRTRAVVASSAIDNLLKGASSQAFENLLQMVAVSA